MNDSIRTVYHADDYGACREVSSHILDCINNGKLTSMSILPNSEALGESMDMYEQNGKRVDLSIHFNIAEGRCMADPKEVPSLVNKKGMFDISFFKLLLLSFTPKRGRLKKELLREYTLQLEAVLPYIEEIRIDSHQHFHMIPLVLETILEVCERASKETKKPITFIRIPAEPLTPFIKNPNPTPGIRPINVIKNLVLNSLNVLDKRMLSPYMDRTAVFFGIMLSGGMDKVRVNSYLPEFRKVAAKRHMPLEVLAHPGGVSKLEDLMDADNEGCREFYMSNGRMTEKKMLMDQSSI